jgi:hypothetical protein
VANYDEELLDAASRLLSRRPGQRGRLSSARIRRSISTSYYALFHFVLNEVVTRVAGTSTDLRIRRRLLARSLTHRGVRTAFDKIRGATINSTVEAFFVKGNNPVVAAPVFAQRLARAFLDAQTKRESADYDLNEPLSETDARLLRSRVRRAIRDWRGARTAADRDFKHALAIIILLKGQLRQDN